MAFDCVIFDLDGTLLNTLDDLCDSVNAALELCGYPRRKKEEVCGFVGNGVARLVALAVPSGTSLEQTAACLAVFKEIYAERCRDKTAPYEGIRELLSALKKKGIKTAIVSNKLDAAVKALSQTYFSGLVDVAIGEQEDKGIRKKPHPDMVLAVMAALSADATRTVYVGDSEVDILTAQNAGIPCLSVTWGFRTSCELTQAGASRLVSTAEALWEAIMGE